jgi:hypothetical protein
LNSQSNYKKDENYMKRILAVALALMCASVAFARDNDDSVVRWKNIVGVITSVGVDNPVSTIKAGATPWSVNSGRARVNLTTGAAFFEVEGLSINGGTATGTPGPISAVFGTLVCNAGQNNQVITDTVAVPLNVHGDANFTGILQNIPSTCSNPLFLVRIAAPAGAAGRWIATGAGRFIGDNDNDHDRN